MSTQTLTSRTASCEALCFRNTISRLDGSRLKNKSALSLVDMQGLVQASWSSRLHGQNKWGFPEIRGTLFGGPYNKDYNIFGSILGSPDFGKLPSGLCIPQEPYDELHTLGSCPPPHTLTIYGSGNMKGYT